MNMSVSPAKLRAMGGVNEKSFITLTKELAYFVWNC